MSAGDGNCTAVFSGTVNRRAPTVEGAGAPGASLEGSNCHGVSGEAGAKSRVSLQAPRRTHPAKATRGNLAGGMQCIPDRRRGRRLRLRRRMMTAATMPTAPHSTQAGKWEPNRSILGA